MSQIQIPKGWNSVTTLDVIKDPKTSIRIGPFGSSLKKAELQDSGIRVLFIENVVNNKFEFKTGKFITPEKYEQLKGFTIKPNDVLVTMMGTIGRVCVVPKNIGTAIISSHLLKITLDQKKILPKYLSLLLSSSIVMKQMKKESRGIAMPGLNSKIIKNLNFLLPPLETQKRIIQKLDYILGQFEEKRKDIIINLKTQIEQLELIEKNLLIEFIKKTIVFDKLPSNWKREKLSKLSTRIGGGTPSKTNAEYYEGNIPWITISDISGDAKIPPIIKNSKLKINLKAVNESSAKLIPEGSVILGTRVGVGKIAIAGTEMCTNQDFNSFVCSKKLEPYFLAFVLLALKSKFIKNSRGATVKGITTGELDELQIAYPDLTTQKKLVQQITNTAKNIEIINSYINETKKKYEILEKYLNSVFPSVLDKAFSGKLVN